MKKIVYFFCIDKKRDPVANNVLDYLVKHYDLQETDVICDNHKVLSLAKQDYMYYCVPLDDVLSHNYDKYMEFIKREFSECMFAGIVNWHEGDNAPNNIFTVHSTGDVPTGVFAPANPIQLNAIFDSLNRNREKYGLQDYRVFIEATHWSGIPYHQSPESILEFGIPIYDIEIGSDKNSWEDNIAISALSDSLFDINLSNITMSAIIGVGGKHFEECFSELVKNEENRLFPGHILANQWVANENYNGEEGKKKLRACVDSIQGEVIAIVYHDNLKGAYKQLCREVAQEYNVECFKHKILRNPEKLNEILYK